VVARSRQSLDLLLNACPLALHNGAEGPSLGEADFEGLLSRASASAGAYPRVADPNPCIGFRRRLVNVSRSSFLLPPLLLPGLLPHRPSSFRAHFRYRCSTLRAPFKNPPSSGKRACRRRAFRLTLALLCYQVEI